MGAGVSARAACSVVSYIAAIVAANVVTAHLGLVPVGVGLMATAGTYFAGFALLARNITQDTAGRLVALAAMAVGIALSVVLATPTLALASGVAFAVSELLDMAVYTPLRARTDWWARAILPASLLGAVADTFIFLSLAGFPLWPGAVGQMVGKGWAIGIPVVVVLAVRKVRDRAVSRQRLIAEGA